MTKRTVLALLVLALLVTLSPAFAEAPPKGGPGVERPDGPPDGMRGGPDGPGGPGGPGGPPNEEKQAMKRKLEEWKQGRDPKEVEAYMKLVEKIRTQSEIWIQMSRLYADKKDPQKALETIRKVLAIEIPAGPLSEEMSKKKAHLYLMAADLCADAGLKDEAQKMIEEGVAQAKDTPEIAIHLYKRMAEIYQKQGKPDEALKALEQASELAEKTFK